MAQFTVRSDPSYIICIMSMARGLVRQGLRIGVTDQSNGNGWGNAED